MSEILFFFFIFSQIVDVVFYENCPIPFIRIMISPRRLLNNWKLACYICIRIPCVQMTVGRFCVAFVVMITATSCCN